MLFKESFNRILSIIIFRLKNSYCVFLSKVLLSHLIAEYKAPSCGLECVLICSEILGLVKRRKTPPLPFPNFPYLVRMLGSISNVHFFWSNLVPLPDLYFGSFSYLIFLANPRSCLERYRLAIFWGKFYLPSQW